MEPNEEKISKRNKEKISIKNEERISAINWIFSSDHSKGSMRWVCDVCNFDYEKLQRLAMSREGRRRILRTK
jgi:hypothetical protein